MTKPTEAGVGQYRKIVSVLVEAGGRRYRVIDNLRDLVGGEHDRALSEQVIGRKVLDCARSVEVGNVPNEKRPKATIEELETILNSPNDRQVEILPDGTVRDAGHTQNDWRKHGKEEEKQEVVQRGKASEGR